jgi:hypothetical protein
MRTKISMLNTELNVAYFKEAYERWKYIVADGTWSFLMLKHK